MAAVTPFPTFAPTGTYIVPPSHSVTHFTPAPSCSPEKLWLVSTQGCSVNGDNEANGRYPSWAECAVTMVGDPHPPWRNPDCYPWPYNDQADKSAFISECPVGYTTVWASQGREPYYDTTTLAEGGTITTTVEYKDIVAHSAVCCPDNAFGGFYYNWDTKSNYISYIKTTDPEGHSARVSLYVPPRCVATSVCGIPPTVTLDAVFNSQIVEKKHRRQDDLSDPISPVGVVTRPWDERNNVLFANEVGYGYTVFHGTYTCFEDCYNYASYSYYNTDPNASASSVDKDLNDSTSDYDPQPKSCSASPTETGLSETSPTGSPSVGTGGFGYHNATATVPGHSTAGGAEGTTIGAPGETGTSAPSPPVPQFPGAATKTGSSSLWTSLIFAIAAIL